MRHLLYQQVQHWSHRANLGGGLGQKVDNHYQETIMQRTHILQNSYLSEALYSPCSTGPVDMADSYLNEIQNLLILEMFLFLL